MSRDVLFINRPEFVSICRRQSANQVELTVTEGKRLAVSLRDAQCWSDDEQDALHHRRHHLRIYSRNQGSCSPRREHGRTHCDCCDLGTAGKNRLTEC